MVIVVTKRFVAVGLFGWGKSIGKPSLNYKYRSLIFNESYINIFLILYYICECACL